jgi:type-F conjugative transfer system pilin assembly protein TrbC
LCSADNLKPADVTAIQNKAKKITKQIKTDNKYMEEMKKQAEKSKECFKSKEYQAKLEAYRNQILNSKQFSNAMSQHTAKNYSKIKSCTGLLNEHERLYIFISSSMPSATIRRYVQDVNKLQDPNIHIILRGFIGGVKYLKPTVEFFVRCAKKDPLCEGPQCKLYNAGFNVNPLPFRKYHIDKVPAFVYVPYEQEITPESITESNEYYKVSGDAKLEYILNLIYEKSKSNSVKSLTEKLKTGFYHR